MLRNFMKKNALLPIRGKFSNRQDRIGTVSAKRMNRRFYKGKGVKVGGKKIKGKDYGGWLPDYS